VVAATEVTLLSLSREDLFSTISTDKIEHMKVLARAQVFTNVALFSRLDPPVKVLIAGALRVDSWTPGSVILRENAHVEGPTRRIYIIETGQCLQTHKKNNDFDVEPDEQLRRGSRAQQMKQHTVACQPGDYLGQLEFLYGCPQLHSLTAVNDCVTLSISFDELKELLKDQGEQASFQRIFVLMERSVRKELIRESHHSLKCLADDDLDRLLDAATSHVHEKYDMILRKGEETKSIIMLLRGCCIEYNADADGLMELDKDEVDCIEHARPGETFGTAALLQSKVFPAPYTLVAISDKVEIIRVSRTVLESLPSVKDSSRRNSGALRRTSFST
jgi:CRP-like cAMP-binding protein